MTLRNLIVLLWLAAAASGGAAGERVRVACIGNSITYGTGTSDPATESYPAQLGAMLGYDKYEVRNFGKPGATMLRKGHNPYIRTSEWASAKAYRPDIAIIHLGVNDTDPRDYPLYGDEFVEDYMAMIDTLRKINPSVRVILAQLTPITASHPRFKSGTRQWRLAIRRDIRRTAAITGSELIDFGLPLRDRQNLLPDTHHPTAEGAALIAREAYRGITGFRNRLSMPDVYQSGMVLQRNRPLRLRGKADAGSTVTVRLDGQTYRTRADRRGDWRVTTRPLVSGPAYTLEVSDGRDTLTLTDILAGEVWIASGQSNMEFRLRQASDTGVTVTEDSLWRFYDMKPVAMTYSGKWCDSIIARVDSLDYFLPARWEAVNPHNAAEFSAVAWHFGRMLRDSLDVPVGIISNAIGGSGIEAWIDAETLEEYCPEILSDWLHNDYLQPWVQGRAAENCGGYPHRHPYEPGYLYAAGMRGLEGYDAAGVIWYQGESNAHSSYMHERLFPLFVRSWRNASGTPLPVITTQLSSLERPAWAEFRDSQRRLAKKIPGVYMAVTSDVGEQYDVHPRRKRPVGERLGRQALHHVYGMSHVTAGGPEVIRAEARDGTIVLTMANGRGMHASDGDTIRSFEIAETDGHYFTAEAKVTGNNQLTIHNMNINKPRYVRYGWQSYSRGNLVNNENLPASTFRMEAENAGDYDTEAGMECGVSAPFAGMSPEGMIMAGGCNFPVDPMATDSRKRFYKGIYLFDRKEGQWKRTGSLPEVIAYGASATLDDGTIALIGGNNGAGALRTAWLLRVNGGKAVLERLPDLPCGMDNMAAAAIGRRVYVAGGNADGVPCRELLCMDTDTDNLVWERLRSMPGNPRVQPVMAAAEGPDGEECLYVCGGFAPRHNGHEPTLDTEGLRYSPRHNKWSRIPAPTTESGEDISLGGGAACTLTDGRIAATGGVNKDVFLAALRDQSADYLQHPAEWYRFNGRVLVFDPRAGEWSVAAECPECARAGAAIAADDDGGFYLTGGEVKPRIRTAETIHIKP